MAWLKYDQFRKKPILKQESTKFKITIEKQDWVTFMSQPYCVEVKVEVEVRLILRLRLI